MLFLYAALLSDLGPGDFAKVDCAAWHHGASLIPEALLRMGLSPATKVLDLKRRLDARGLGERGYLNLEYRDGALNAPI